MQALKYFIKRNFSQWLYHRQKAIARKMDMQNWLEKLAQYPPQQLSAASFDIFTYHGEDGIIQYLLQHIKEVSPFFADIGAGDCIKSNCANLAVHFGWAGLFIDQDQKQLELGRRFYKDKIKAGADINFVEAEVTAENINQLIQAHAAGKQVGLLSIDIDGNDYWIWKAIDVIQPQIVLIEAKVEFGYKDLVVPYGKRNHHSADKMYNGASVEALRKLGKEKRYKLAGANKQGYNLFFVKQGTILPEATTETILANPETVGSFYLDSFFTTYTSEII
jgi:hypothetical protein